MKDLAYFRLLTIQSADKYTIYSDSEKYESTFLNLSTNGNTFMNKICDMLYKNPMSVSLISDCADASGLMCDIMNEINPNCLVKSYGLFHHIYKLVWGEDVHAINPEYSNRGRLLCTTYLINHNKRVYFDLPLYMYDNHTEFQIHPLASLTVVGNTSCIEHYDGKGFRQVIPAGSWAFDVISIDIEPPKGYKKFKRNFVISNEFNKSKDPIYV